MSRWGHTRAGCAQHPVGRRNMGPRESSLPTRTSARRQTTWCRRMCGCGFRSEKRVHGRNKTQEEEKEQEQPKRKSLEGRVVGKTRGQKGKSHEDKGRGRGWAWLWRQDMTAHGAPAGMTPRRTGGSDSTGLGDGTMGWTHTATSSGILLKYQHFLVRFLILGRRVPSEAPLGWEPEPQRSSLLSKAIHYKRPWHLA